VLEARDSDPKSIDHTEVACLQYGDGTPKQEAEMAVIGRFFRPPPASQTLQDEIDALATAQEHRSRPTCGGKAMSNHDTHRVPFLAWNCANYA